MVGQNSENLEIVARLRDETSRELRALRARLKLLDKTFDDMNRGAQAGAKKTGAAFVTLGSRIRRIAPAILGIGSALAVFGIARRVLNSAVDGAVDFGNAMSEVSTIIDTSTVSVDALSDAVREVAIVQGQAQTVVARGLYQAISAGADAASGATDELVQAGRLAVAGLTGIDRTVDLLSSTLNAYGRENLEAARASDVFFKTVERGKTTIPELAGALGRVLPIAAELDVEIEELSAAIAALTLGGIQTDVAIIGLRQVLISLLNPSVQAKEVIEDLNLQVTAADIRARGLAATFEELTTKLGGNDEAISAIFGNVRALVPILALTGAQAETFKDILVDLEGAAGATAVAFEKRLASSAFQVESAFNALSIGLSEIGDALIEPLTGSIKNAEDFKRVMEELRQATKTLQPPIILLATGLSAVGTVAAFLNVGLQAVIGTLDILRAGISDFINGTDTAGDATERFGQRLDDAERLTKNLLSVTLDLFTGIGDLGGVAETSASSLKRLGDAGAGATSRFTQELEAAREKIVELVQPVDLEVVRQIDELEARVEAIRNFRPAPTQPGEVTFDAAKLKEQLGRELDSALRDLQEIRIQVLPGEGIERSRQEINALADSLVRLRDAGADFEILAPQVTSFETALIRIREETNATVAAIDEEARKINPLEDSAGRIELLSEKRATARNEERLSIERLISIFPDLTSATDRAGRSNEQLAEGAANIVGEGKRLVQVFDEQGNRVSRVVSENFKLIDATGALDKVLGEINTTLEQEIGLIEREVVAFRKDLLGRLDATKATKEEKLEILALVDQMGEELVAAERLDRANDDLTDARKANREETDKQRIAQERAAQVLRDTVAEFLREDVSFSFFDDDAVRQAEQLLDRLTDIQAQAGAASAAARDQGARGLLDVEERLLEIKGEQVRESQRLLEQALAQGAVGQAIVGIESRILELSNETLSPFEQRTRELERQAELAEEQIDSFRQLLTVLESENVDSATTDALRGVIAEAERELDSFLAKLDASSGALNDFFADAEGASLGFRKGLVEAQAELSDIEGLMQRGTFDLLVGGANDFAAALTDVALGFDEDGKAFERFAINFLRDIALMQARALAFRLFSSALNLAGVPGAGGGTAAPPPGSPDFSFDLAHGGFPPGKLPGIPHEGAVLAPGPQEAIVRVNEAPGLREAVVPLERGGGNRIAARLPGGIEGSVSLGRVADGRLGVDLADLSAPVPVERLTGARTGDVRNVSAPGLDGALAPGSTPLLRGLATSLSRDGSTGGVGPLLAGTDAPPAGAGSPFEFATTGGPSLGRIDKGLTPQAAPLPEQAPAGAGDAKRGEGGGSIAMDVNIQAVDAASFLQLAARDPEALAQIVLTAARSHPSIRSSFQLRGRL